MNRKYLSTLGDLIDRLTITQLKEVKIPEHKEEYTNEIKEILDDINMILTEQQAREFITAEYLRDIIIVAQFNAHVWYNEWDIREKIKEMTNGREMTIEEYAEIGKRLILTHSINGIRNTAKNRVNKIIGGRLDYKIDCLAADAEQWRPSGY